MRTRENVQKMIINHAMIVSRQFGERACLWFAPFVIFSLATLLAVESGDRLSFSFLLTEPIDDGRAGGIGPILVNTMIVVAGALAIATPIAFSAAIILAKGEMDSKSERTGLAHLVKVSVDIGVSIPRLIWGLAGAAIFGGFFGLGISALTGILTLAFLLIPMLVVGFADGLTLAGKRFVPTALSLGMSPTTAWISLAVPGASASLLVSFSIAVGRACGDAAALLITSGIGTSFIDGLDAPGSTIAVHIFILLMEIGGGTQSAAAAGIVLLLLTVLLQLPLLAASQNGGRK